MSISAGYEPIRSAGLRSSTISIPVIKPRPRTLPIQGNSWAIFLSSSRKNSPRIRAFSAKFLLRISSNTWIDAAIASWLPRKVPVWPAGAHASNFLLMASTHSGKPPPTALLITTTSGTMSACSKANILPERANPACTSSKINTISCLAVTSRIFCSHFLGAGTTPPSPWIASRMTAAGLTTPLSTSSIKFSK